MSVRKALITTVWAVCALLLPYAAPANARASDEDVVIYRQGIMKSLDAQFEAVMLILTHRAPKAHILLHMEALLLTTDLSAKSFEPRVAGGRSTHKVWDDPAGFAAKMKEFKERMATAVAMTRAEGAPGALQGLEYVSCEKCHNVYLR